MMMWAVAMGIAWAGPFDGLPTDVSVSRGFPTSADEVHRMTADLAVYRALFPEDCAKNWLVRQPTAGLDATLDVRYTFGPLRRRLTAVVTKDTPGALFQLEHKGPRGWFTQFRFEPGDRSDTSRVTLLTPLSAPPWPLRRIFHRRVRPAMEACYQRALDTLHDRVSAEVNLRSDLPDQ